jgi:hypothetical protein
MVHGLGAYFPWTSGSIPTSQQYCNCDNISIAFDDPRATWHFGFKDASGNIVKNYTEYRYWCAIRWLCSGKAPWQGDSNEVFIYGHSMGGTGSMTFTLHHPEIFSYIDYASEGVNNWVTMSNYISSIWGSKSENLECRDLINKDKLIDDRDVGMGVWGWQSVRDSVIPTIYKRKDLPFLNFAHGTQDGSIEWMTQGMPIWSDHGNNMFAKNKIPYSGAWVNQGHTKTEAGINTCSRVPKTHFVLAVKNAGCDDQLASGCNTSLCNDAGQFNARVKWSTLKTPFNGDPVDSYKVFETTIRIDIFPIRETADYTGPMIATADITPRRLQNFYQAPNANYHWENIPRGSTTPTASGDIQSDADGILTVEGFTITPGGNKLRITAIDVGTEWEIKPGASQVRVEAFPNPFKTSVTINISMPNDGLRITNTYFTVHDITGRQVYSSIGNRNSTLEWNASDRASGIYLAKIRAGNQVYKKKLVLIK